MIVSPSHKFVFVHIPKNGGTTTERLLVPHLVSGSDIHVSRGSTLPLPSQLASRFKDSNKHATARDVRRALGRKVFDDFFSFAISRNPYARCFSAYRFVIARSEMDIRRAEMGMERRKSRREDRRADPATLANLSFEAVCHDLVGYSKKFPLFKPQVKWLPQIDSVDFIARLENLDGDLAVIFDQIGLPTNGLVDIKPANQKAAPMEWRSMSPDCAANIRAYYASDFERFGYSLEFNGPDTAPERSLRDRRSKRSGDGLASRLLHRVRSAFAS